jgi:hypothetical protein
LSLNNVFTSTYSTYILVIDNCTQTSAGNGIYYRMRTAGVIQSDNLYYVRGLTSTSAVAMYGSSTPGTTGLIHVAHPTTRSGAQIVMANPALPAQTSYTTSHIYDADSYWSFGGMFAKNQAHDGIEILTLNGTMSGNFRVYGYRSVL